MRRLMTCLGAAAVVLAVVANTGAASGGPRLQGAFKIAATIQGNDFGIRKGTKTADVYKLTPTCPSGGCANVKLDRDGGNHAHYKSTLHRVASGKYKGTEGPEAYNCPDNSAGSFTADHAIAVTRSENGRATKFTGSIKIHFKGCTEKYINYTIVGTPKN